MEANEPTSPDPGAESGEETLVGGQAVMEGVMMRAPHSYCVAVRKASGEIVTEEMELTREWVQRATAFIPHPGPFRSNREWPRRLDRAGQSQPAA